MIASIEHRGVLIHEVKLAGHTRADDVFPAHPNGIQVSRNRFMLVFATRGWRGVDDDLSACYQLREGSYDGPILKEGIFESTRNDWDPLENGTLCVKQHGHPVGFGLPKGALIRGKPASHANLFAVKWRRNGRFIDPKSGFMLKASVTSPRLDAGTAVVEWLQFRLNEAEDDIEIVQPMQLLRQKGFGTGYAFCGVNARFMCQSFVQPAPLNEDCTEWIDCNHFDEGRLAMLRYQFNPERGIYEWVQTGPLFGGDLSEANVSPCRGAWVLGARVGQSSHAPTGGPVAWARLDDPFGQTPELVYPPEPRTKAPVTAYRCPDGVLRLLTGDRTISPYGGARNPLYLWDIDPDQGFAASNRQVVFDTKAAGLPFRDASGGVVDMAKILPHAGGSTQFLVHRVRSVSINDPARTGMAINAEEKNACAIYYARIHYTEALPGCWQF